MNSKQALHFVNKKKESRGPFHHHAKRSKSFLVAFFQKSNCFLAFFLLPYVALAQPDPALVAQGKYLARAGDCAACHTSNFAGGLGIASPIGTIFSSNITPDQATGIGTWSYDDFARLMRTGKTKQGYILYPAMPYPSYSRITDADMHALYAYFMLGVPAVDQTVRRPQIPWPLSMRWPLHIWVVSQFENPKNETAQK